MLFRDDGEAQTRFEMTSVEVCLADFEDGVGDGAGGGGDFDCFTDFFV